MRTKLGHAIRQVALGGVLAAAATGGFAATQGTTGFTSTGDLDISLTVNEEVKISNLVDITLPVFNGTDVSDTSDACIYRNGGGNYQITATGSGPANAFQLVDGGNTVSVNYAVAYDDGTGFSALTSGSSLASSGASDIDDDCVTDGADNATIQVTVAAADASALPADTYSGTLTLLVAPN